MINAPELIVGPEEDINLLWLPEASEYIPFTDLIDEVEEQEPDDEDVEMVASSDEEQDGKEEDTKGDDPMGEDEEQPEAKRRKIVKLIQSISSFAEEVSFCLACGTADHSIASCANADAKSKVTDACQVILSSVQPQRPSNMSKPSGDGVGKCKSKDRCSAVSSRSVNASKVCDLQGRHCDPSGNSHTRFSMW